MVQFYPWFWGMVMYGKEFETKENKIELQHLLVVLHLQFVTSSLFIDVFVKLNGQFFRAQLTMKLVVFLIWYS